MNAHVDPHPHGAVAARPPSRLDVTERDERMLAMREDGRTAKEIGAALGLPLRRVVERVTKLRRAGLDIPNVARARSLTRAPSIQAEQFCEHRVYVVTIDETKPVTPLPRPRPNAEALRQHYEELERRQRMAMATPQPALVPPPPTSPVTPTLPAREPVDRATPGEQTIKDVPDRLWARRLAHAHPIQRVIMVTAREFGLELSDITGPRRSAHIVRPRQVAMYLAKTLTAHSLPEIGRRFGGKDHTTVLHAVRKVEGLIAGDPDLAHVVAALRARIQEATS